MIRQKSERRREFSNIRPSYSRVKDKFNQSRYTNSKSPQPIAQSRLTDRPQKELANNVSRFQIAKQSQKQITPRRHLQKQKQTQPRPNSKSVSRVRSHSHNNLVCVGCYNKKLSQANKMHKRDDLKRNQQQERQLKRSLIKQDDHRKILQQSIIKHSQSVNEYNKRVTEEKSTERYRRRAQEQKLHIEQKQKQFQYLKEKQNMSKIQHQRREQLKRELQKQIQAAKAKKQQQLYTFKQTQIGSILPTQKYSQETVQRIYEEHKRQLKTQIQQNQRRKQRQQEQQRQELKNGTEFQLITYAEERNKISKQYEQKLRDEQINAFNQKKSRQAQRQKIQYQKRRQEEQNRRRLAEDQRAQNQINDCQRRQKIDHYLSDLKKQMQQNKSKRIQQLRRLNGNRQTQSLIIHEQAHNQHCGGCQKQYPVQFLSQFHDYE